MPAQWDPNSPFLLIDRIFNDNTYTGIKKRQKEPAQLHFHSKRSGLRGRPELEGHQIEHILLYNYGIK